MDERPQFHLAECVCSDCLPALPKVGDVIQIRFLNEETGQEEVLGSAIVTNIGSGDEPGAVSYQLLTSSQTD